MFTGIVQELGVVSSIHQSPNSVRVTIAANKTLKGLKRGGSIAVNGVCLTATIISKTSFSADLLPETLQDTNVGILVKGDKVNLESAMRLQDRINGHLVSGHVEGVGVIQERKEIGNTLSLKISIPKTIGKYCILKGSIAVDGVSLTIQSFYRGGITVAIIPSTAKMTTLGIKEVGAFVNLESDFIRKYVQRM
ncbi:MAG: riboflavin synthase [Nitrospirae bacterium]|nr:riboflavin synthase [Candidatus Troglogloeales bacterium]